jgi:16S rRNA (cytidine1402-2'-O)-methyltransferase
MPGTLFVVATPIGNLEDITLRALRVLKEVELIAAEDTRRTGQLLAHFGVATPATSLHDHNERSRTPRLIARLEAGACVALVSDAGTPLLSDPGLRLIRAAVEAGIPVVPIPGPSAVTAALSIAGVPVDAFHFAGFPPVRQTERRRWLAELAAVPGSLVLFEAPHRIRETLRETQAQLGNRWVVIVRELTKIHESVTRGWLEDLQIDEVPERGEFTIVVSALTKRKAAEPREVDTFDVAAEFGELTARAGLSRKDAVQALAERHQLPRQDIYRRLNAAEDGTAVVASRPPRSAADTRPPAPSRPGNGIDRRH